MPEVGEISVDTLMRTLPSFAVAPEMYEAPKKQWGPDDEYNLSGFKPLTLRGENLPEKMRDDEVSYWNKNLRYLSMTKGLEFDSDRTRIIESKLKEAAEKSGDGEIGKTIRVVIMNKGLTDDAFVAPDNTIFITQHLIHELGFLDSTMGVAAHEMGHAADGAYENIGQIDPLKMLSARWLSEPSADLRTPKYLDSIGLNSTGLEIALATLEKLHPEESGRSPIYQEMTQRRAVILGKHKLQHFRHGAKELTALPQELDVEAKPTNLEILKASLENEDYVSALGVLPKLCKKDLEHVYTQRWSVVQTRDDERKYTNQNRQVSHELNTLLTTRLTEAGYDETEIKYFLLCIQDSRSMPIDHGLVENPEQLLEMSRRFKEFELGGLHERAVKEVFGTEHIRTLQNFLSVLNDQMRDIRDTRFPQNEGIPVTKEALLEVLKNISDAINDKQFRQASSMYQSQITEVLHTYATVWLNTKEETMKDFFERAKSMGIAPSTDRQRVQSLARNESKQFGDHTIEKIRGRSEAASGAFIDVFIGKEERTIEPVEEKPIVNEEFIDSIFSKIRESENSEEGAQAFNGLLRDLRDYCDRERIDDNQRLHLLEHIFNNIDNLPLNKAEFYSRDREELFSANIPDLLKIGEVWKFHNLPDFKNEENMELVAKLANFNLKFVAALSTFQHDGAEFYQTIQGLMNSSNIDVSDMSIGEVMRLCRSLFSLDIKGIPQEINIMGFGTNATESIWPYNVDRNWWGETKTPRVVVIKDMGHLEKLPFVKEILSRKTDVQIESLDELISLSGRLREEYSDFFGTHYPGHYESYYGDTAALVILGEPVRQGLSQLLERGAIDYTEFDKLHDLLSSVLPDSVDKDEILKGIRAEYLSAPLPLAEKIKFFKDHSEELGTEGLVTLASQIRGEKGKPGSVWASWEYFRDEMSELMGQYIKGERSLARIAVVDSITSYLSDKYDLVLSSADASPEHARKISTELADIWVDKTMITPERSFGLGVRETLGEYNFDTGKFQLTKNGRTFFRSFDDVVRTLHNMEVSERAGIVMKALVGNRGALSTEEGRTKLAEFIRASLQLEDPFMGELVDTLCEQAVLGSETRTVFTILGSHLMGNLLFRGIKTESVDPGKILEERRGLSEKIGVEELRQVLSKKTREITAFGAQYQHQPESLLAKRVQESDDQYDGTMNSLRGRFIHKEGFKDLEIDSEVPVNVEALFRGAETTILGTRSIQTTRQMRRFENQAVDRRMAKSFDANPGMDPLRFFLALDSYAQLDPNLKSYLQNNLIDIEGFLAGGSMASTYVAKVLSTRNPGEEVEVVIRELTPGADLEITKIGNTFLHALDAMAAKPRRKEESKKEYTEKQKNIRLAQVVLRFTMDWCLADIRDPNYEVNDDKFKEQVVLPFNRISGSDVVRVPEREFTSEGSWVRVETRAKGQTLREYLDDPEVSSEAKSDVIWLMSKFNYYQTGQSVENDGKALVQSDPSIGNYIVEETSSGPAIHVLDRGLMIPLNKRRIEMIRTLVDGNNGQFLQQLVSEVVDYNIENNDKFKQLDQRSKRKLEASLRGQIMFKVLSSKIFGRTSNLLDNVTTVNDVFIQENLMLPYEIEVPIKNVAGISMLVRDYASK